MPIFLVPNQNREEQSSIHSMAYNLYVDKNLQMDLGENI